MVLAWSVFVCLGKGGVEAVNIAIPAACIYLFNRCSEPENFVFQTHELSQY